jgi:hypothetical protein
MKPSLNSITSVAVLALGFLSLTSLSAAQSKFAFQGLYAGNGGAFTAVDSNGSETTGANPFSVQHSFSGKDSKGKNQTMTISGSAWSYVDYGKIHIDGQGTVTNPYYSAANSPYYDGTFDPNGSPDLLAINGNAGFSDVLTYSSPQNAGGTGYLVNFYFRLEGSTSGDTLAGLNFTTSDPLVGSYNPRTKNGYELWVTPSYHMEWNQNLTINADFFAGFNTQVSQHAEGVSYSGSARYGNTLELAGMRVLDSNGNEVRDFTVNSASGTAYNPSPVPEPCSLIALGLGGLGLLKRRSR